MNERPVLVLTGASAGIGAALALRASRAGYAIVACGRNSEALGAIAARIMQEGGSIVTLVGDVRDTATSRRIADFADESFGRIDVVVANAGIAGRGPIVIQSDDELQEQLETHVLAPVTLIRSCLPLLVRAKGTAFVLGSGVARMPIGGMGLYPASKAALRSIARTLRGELARLGVGLTYVDPGAVDTEFMRRRAMPGAPKVLLVSPHTVARRILGAIAKRPAELNVVGWQTGLLGVAELFPKLTDFVLARAGAITGAPLGDPRLSRHDAVLRLREDQPRRDVSSPPNLRIVNSASATPTSSTASGSSAIAFHAGLDHGTLDHVSDQPADQSGDALVSQVPSENEQSITQTLRAEEIVAAAITPTSDESPAVVAPRPRPAAARVPKSTDDDRFSNAVSALTPRMRRLNFAPDMLRSRLRIGVQFTEDDVALDWVGMPNKNERKLITDICSACAEAGLLNAIGERQWLVIAAAETAPATA